MYSEEINKLLKLKNYILEYNEYIKMCKDSPQISMVKYNSFEDKIEIWTKDNYYAKFKVYKKD